MNVSHKLAEAMYAKTAGSGAQQQQQQAGAEQQASDKKNDDVVDADFEDVK